MKNAAVATRSRVKLVARSATANALNPGEIETEADATRHDDAADGTPSAPYNGSITNATRTTSMRITGSSGSMALLTEYDDATARELRSLRLESTEDGKGILLIEVDERKPGIHREVRYEITPAELIAAIRAHGAELPGEQHNHRQ
ncbi:hypothetical protein QFZ89_004313 [Paraburkholderia youngii]